MYMRKLFPRKPSHISELLSMTLGMKDAEKIRRYIMRCMLPNLEKLDRNRK